MYFVLILSRFLTKLYDSNLFLFYPHYPVKIWINSRMSIKLVFFHRNFAADALELEMMQMKWIIDSKALCNHGQNSNICITNSIVNKQLLDALRWHKTTFNHRFHVQNCIQLCVGITLKNKSYLSRQGLLNTALLIEKNQKLTVSHLICNYFSRNMVQERWLTRKKDGFTL